MWPGYVTSIRQHEQDILLCAEISHKIMRMDNVFDLLNNTIQQTRGDFREAFQKLVIGKKLIFLGRRYAFFVRNKD